MTDNKHDEFETELIQRIGLLWKMTEDPKYDGTLELAKKYFGGQALKELEQAALKVWVRSMVFAMVQQEHATKEK